MRKIFIIGIFLILNQYLMAENYECMYYTQEVDKKMLNISENKDNLSEMAKKSLYRELSQNIQFCLSACTGSNFSYCNSVAKEIEKSK